MNKYIKNILPTRGWQEIEKMFNTAISNCGKQTFKDKSDEIVAREARVKQEVVEELETLLNNIKIAGTENKPKETKYI